MLPGKSIDNLETTTRELVSVSLKTLIDLAKPAAGMKLHQLSSRSRQSGDYVSRFKGRGMEFDETRLYQAGDDIRSIDWRVTARTGKAHTKVFREERERPVFISVDNRPAMHFATRGVFKSVLAAKLAGLLAWTAEGHGDRIGGQVFSDRNSYEIKPRNGKHGVLRFFNALVTPQEQMGHVITLEHTLARLTQHTRPGSLVYIISDFRGMTDQAETYLAKLSQHCDVVLIFVYDLLESSLPAKGRFRFTDDQRDVIIDTGDSQRLNNYRELFLQRRNRIASVAKKLKLAFISCNTTEDPLQILKYPLEHK
jgi:uncharacterized protein (DUF58 family)